MKRIIFVIIGVIVLAALITAFVFLKRPTTLQNVSVSNDASSSVGGVLVPVYRIPTSTTLLMGTPRGAVTVKNFYATALGAEDQFVVLVRNDSFEITYDVATSAFFIGLKKSSPDIRIQAERSFMFFLGVSESDACILSPVVGLTMGSFSQSSGLSFCGATAQ